MFIEHVVHGLLIVVVVFFGMPALFSLAFSTMSGTRTSSGLSIRYLAKGMHVMFQVIAQFSDAIADGIADQFPEQPTWLKPVLKKVITTLFIFGELYLTSVLTGN